MMASNHNPFVNEQSGALKRRLLQIPFDKKPKKKDEKLLEKLVSQLDAFINHLLSLDDNYVTETLGNANSSPLLSHVEWEQAAINDSVAWWLNEYVIADKTAKTPVGNNKDEFKDSGSIASDIKTLYGSYHYRCQKEGRVPKSNTAFSKQLLELCIDTLGLTEVEKKRNSHHAFITGLRLRTEGADDNILTMGELMLSEGDSTVNPTYPTLSSHSNGFNPTLNPTLNPTSNPTLPVESINEVEAVEQGKEDESNSVGLSVDQNVGLSVGLEPLPDKESVEYVELEPTSYKGKFRAGNRIRVISPDHPFYGMTGTVQCENFKQWVKVSFHGELPREAKGRSIHTIDAQYLEIVKQEK